MRQDSETNIIVLNTAIKYKILIHNILMLVNGHEKNASVAYQLCRAPVCDLSQTDWFPRP